MSNEISTEMASLAVEKIGITSEAAMGTGKKLPGTNAFYFSNPVRGGSAIIIDDDGSYLYATSLSSAKEHIQAFLDGKRS